MDPDLRLGQLVVIGASPGAPCPEVFFVEDEQLLEGLRRYQQVRAAGVRNET